MKEIRISLPESRLSSCSEYTVGDDGRKSKWSLCIVTLFVFIFCLLGAALFALGNSNGNFDESEDGSKIMFNALHTNSSI